LWDKSSIFSIVIICYFDRFKGLHIERLQFNEAVIAQSRGVAFNLAAQIHIVSFTDVRPIK
jgi:hypothetical protein